jgi:hypothetical protein
MKTSARIRLLIVSGVALGLMLAPAVKGQAPAGPSARLIPAPLITFPALADSNSPAVWERVDGQLRLFVFNSESGVTARAEGSDVSRLSTRGLVTFDGHPGHGVWMEAIVPDVDGVWYGYYHNELPAEVCDDAKRTIPRIGAARSTDFGATWTDLGVVLEAPRDSYDCGSANEYFVGGVGDFSVVLDQEQKYLYFFFSQYANRESAQGVSAARIRWADRDDPVGRISVWLRGQTWLPARMTRAQSAAQIVYPAGGPIYRAGENWHGASVDAFWGPSVHWNTYLEQYVMLLNRAQDRAWTQEGVYVAFTPTLSDPGTWSIPQRLITAAGWYPQVLGTETGSGHDRQAGQRARFFLAGRSHYLIEFTK